MIGGLRFASLALLAAFLAVVGYGYRHGVSQEEDTRYRDHLRRLRDHTTALDAALLESRSGIVNHYDDIVMHVKARDEEQQELEKQKPTFLDDVARDELQAGLARLDQSLAEQRNLIERFKTHNAVLRNSLRFLPHVARDLVDTVTAHPEGTALATELNALFAEVLLFHDFGERYRIPRVRARLEALLATERPWLPARTTASLRLLARHAAVVLDEKPVVDGLVANIGHATIDDQITGLHLVYQRHHRTALETQIVLRLVAFMLALASVVLGAAFVILRMQRSARALRRTSRDLERALASLEIEKNKQKDLAELKSRFVSMTSHEFRTPLSVILSSAELLETYGEGWGRDKRQNHLTRIQHAARQMKRMLEAVLLIGRSEAGMLKFQPREVDVAALCRDIVDGLRLDSARHTIALSLRGELHSLVVDDRLLGHVLTNLLANAIKYSPHAEVVSLEVERTDDELVISVSDEGIGIPEQDQAHLAESFHRGSNVGNISGTGLGLAIVHKAVELHGGHVEVESEVDHGTTFVVRLPLGGSDLAARDYVSSPERRSASRP
jgi:signal transduction histidine kinase